MLLFILGIFFESSLNANIIPNVQFCPPEPFFCSRTIEGEIHTPVVAISPSNYSELVQDILNRYSIRNKISHSNQLITLRLHPRNWEIYRLLQLEIASLIPVEEMRPTIDLTLTTSIESNVKTSIGIAGGTGPLSDSELMESIMNALEKQGVAIHWDDFAINLFSSPPPRSFHEKMWRLASYGRRMEEFATRGHHKFYMASNTAHSHLSLFEYLVGKTSYRRGVEVRKNPVVNLVNYVSLKTLQNNRGKKPSILILGTLEAYKNRLYPNYLKNIQLVEGTQTAPIPDNKLGQFLTVLNLARAKELQSLIDMAKSAQIEQAGTKLKEFILQELETFPKQDGPIKIILGCTELPMALRKGRMDALQTELQNRFKTQIDFIDSEQSFAEKIIVDIKALAHSQ